MAARQAEITETDIQDWCCQYLARVLKRTPDQIDRQARFASIGLDSAESLFLVSALEDWSGLELDSETAFDHPSVAELSRFVASRISGQYGVGSGT
jgi:acyl carrier protein